MTRSSKKLARTHALLPRLNNLYLWPRVTVTGLKRKKSSGWMSTRPKTQAARHCPVRVFSVNYLKLISDNYVTAECTESVRVLLLLLLLLQRGRQGYEARQSKMRWCYIRLQRLLPARSLLLDCSAQHRSACYLLVAFCQLRRRLHCTIACVNHEPFILCI